MRYIYHEVGQAIMLIGINNMQRSDLFPTLSNILWQQSNLNMMFVINILQGSNFIVKFTIQTQQRNHLLTTFMNLQIYLFINVDHSGERGQLQLSI
jgi:hypothetical protein